MSYLVKIAGIWALSAATVAGMSLFAPNALAAEDAGENENIAAEAEANAEVAEADEGNTAESSEAIIYRRYPGFYYGYPGYRYYRPYFRPYYRPYYPYYRPYYRPYYHPYYRPFYGHRYYGPWGYGW
jgi:hypothetical protein